MLVLTRKVGERIQLGDNITVTLVKINGNIVRLGIEAPKSVPIHRSEVFAAIQSQQAAAESAVTSDQESQPPAS